MYRALVCVLTCLATACASEGKEEESTRWKAKYTEAECRVLMAPEAIIHRCGGGNLDRAGDALNADPASCIPFAPSHVMSGVWVSGFEFSAFYEGANTYTDVVADEGAIIDGDTWFSPVGGAEDALGSLPSIDDGMAFRVEFIGRKSLCDGEYGHMGNASREVIANHFLSIQPLKVLTPAER